MAEDQPPVPDSTPPTSPPAEAAGSAPAAAAPAAAAPTPAAAPAEGAAFDLPSDSSANLPGIDQAAIDEILKQASFEDPPQAGSSAAADSGASSAPSLPAEELKLPDFQQVMKEAQVSSVDLLRDVDLNVKIELGRAHMLVEDVLKLTEGSVVELDKLAGDPVDVFVNERLVARGEVLVLNDNFCVRINEIVAGAKDEEL
ncbi:MAG: flagellar motor switch protein FliN [Bacillota bacterium]